MLQKLIISLYFAYIVGYQNQYKKVRDWKHITCCVKSTLDFLIRNFENVNILNSCQAEQISCPYLVVLVFSILTIGFQ